MAQVIAGLVAGRSVRQVAETTGTPISRITRWYKTSEPFQEMLEEVSTEVTQAILAETVTEATEAVVALSSRAVEVLEAMLDAERESVRLAAAAHVLRFSGMGSRAPSAGPSIEDIVRKGRTSAGPAHGD